MLLKIKGYLAQLVEQLAYNEKVSGSSPLLPKLLRVWWNWQTHQI